MSESRISFKFPLVDLKGTPIASDSLLGSVGFSQKYSGVTSDEDRLVRAVRSSLAGEKVDVEQAALLRSFMADWLTGRHRKLSDAVSYSVELRQCISFLSQVGFLDRTVTYAGHAALGVATLALTWDCFVSEGFGIESLSKVAPVEVAAIGLPLKFEAEINKRFGEPGSSVSRASFDLKPILMFLQCCHMRMVIDDVEGDESLIKSLTRILDWQTFSLFMLNSR